MSKQNLVSIALMFLRWFCPDHLHEEIEGDLMQRFNRDARRDGPRLATWLLWWSVIRFFRPGILFRNKFSIELKQLYMLRTYVVLASRNIVRNKVFSFVNIMGLSVSMVVCILILQYVLFELSYDRFHDRAEDVYRVTTSIAMQKEVINSGTNTYVGIREALKHDFPEVKAATTIGAFTSDDTFIRYEDKSKRMQSLQSFKGFGVDSAFFSVFSFPLLQGDPHSVVKDPYSAVVSEAISNQYFEGNAVGKMIETYDGEERLNFKITGILKEIPSNSHFKFDLLVRGPSNTKTFFKADIKFWDFTGQTYIRMDDKQSVALLEKKLNTLAASKNDLKRNKDDYGQVSTFTLQPLPEIHLYSHLLYELEPNGSHVLVLSLIILAALIVIIAWVNYINLSTALSEEKIRAIGIRKIVGAGKIGLIFQTLTESALFNILAVTIALILSFLLLPSFSAFAGFPLRYQALFDKTLLLSLAGFVVLSTLMAGLYPSYFIASFYPIRALKRMVPAGSNFTLRKALVVFQFSTAVMLMITTVVAYKQLSFMRTTELGMNIDNVIVVKAMNFDKEMWSNKAGGFVLDSTYLGKAEVFKNELRSGATVINATTLSHLPGDISSWGTEFKAPAVDSENAFRLRAIGIDYDFVNTLQVKVLAGRNFSPEFPTDRGNEGKRAVLLNAAASSLLGFKTPREAVGSHITTYWGADYEVIGVINSFHQLSLKENLEPLYFILQPRALSYFAIHFRGDIPAAMDQIKQKWDEHFPGYPFQYFFLDEYFDRQYHDDQKFSRVMGLFSGLAIFIACLGLFGLTSYSIVQRTKEIGIRKVLGATVANIIGLFTRDLVRLVLIANAIVIPFIYFGIDRWLETYAFRITLGVWFFILPVVFVLGIALVTVSLQTIKVATQNPVDSLKYE